MAPRIAVVGGGPAGAIAATLLARAGYRVAVFDLPRAAQLKFGECLPGSGVNLLRKYKLLSPDFAERHLPCYGVRSAWGSAAVEDRDYVFERDGCGWHLDRAAFEHGLRTFACESGVDWREGVTIADPTRSDRRWRFSARAPGASQPEEADLVIDATGRPSAICRKLGVTRMLEDRLMGAALLFDAPPEPREDSFTQIESVADGWWYSAPVPGGQLAAVFATDHDLPAFETARSSSGLLALLRAAPLTAERLAGCHPRPAAVPAILAAGCSRLDRSSGQGWLAVGDSAAAYDPLSSHGIVAAIGLAHYAALAASRMLHGESDAGAVYQDIADTAYASCRAMLTAQYRLEQRWASHPFWRRRS